MHRVVCGECMEAARTTWMEIHGNLLLPKGTFIKVRITGKDRFGETKNEYPWVKVTKDSHEGEEVEGTIENDMVVVTGYDYEDEISVPRELILNHVDDGDFEAGDMEMQKRIQSVHRH